MLKKDQYATFLPMMSFSSELVFLQPASAVHINSSFLPSNWYVFESSHWLFQRLAAWFL